MTNSLLSPTDIFYKYLEVLPATTQALLYECFRIRYQVYCIDNNWEETNERGLETDHYDTHAIQYLLRFRRTKTSAGTTRLVLPQQANLESSFPSQEICESSFRHLPLETTAEGSRIILTRFSRHDEFDSISDARAVIPNIFLGLLAGYLKGCRENSITHFCCTLDDGFIRLLEKRSLYFDAIGEPTFVHDKERQPCSVDLEKLIARCKKEQPEIWRLVTHD